MSDDEIKVHFEEHGYWVMGVIYPWGQDGLNRFSNLRVTMDVDLDTRVWKKAQAEEMDVAVLRRKIEGLQRLLAAAEAMNQFAGKTVAEVDARSIEMAGINAYWHYANTHSTDGTVSNG